MQSRSQTLSLKDCLLKTVLQTLSPQDSLLKTVFQELFPQDCLHRTVRLSPQDSLHCLHRTVSLHTVERVESVESVEAKTVPQRQSCGDSPKKITKPTLDGWIATLVEASGRHPEDVLAEIKERAYTIHGKQIQQLTEPEAKTCAVMAARVDRVEVAL